MTVFAFHQTATSVALVLVDPQDVSSGREYECLLKNTSIGDTALFGSRILETDTSGGFSLGPGEILTVNLISTDVLYVIRRDLVDVTLEVMIMGT